MWQLIIYQAVRSSQGIHSGGTIAELLTFLKGTNMQMKMQATNAVNTLPQQRNRAA